MKDQSENQNNIPHRPYSVSHQRHRHNTPHGIHHNTTQHTPLLGNQPCSANQSPHQSLTPSIPKPEKTQKEKRKKASSIQREQHCSKHKRAALSTKKQNSKKRSRERERERERETHR